MSATTETSIAPLPMWSAIDTPEKKIKIRIFPTPSPSELVVKQLASIEGAVDLYFWYEGTQYLPESGAKFMKERLFQPLYLLKKDAKLYLYSLQAWNFHKNIGSIPSSTQLGEAINRIDAMAIECIYSSSFFQYCTEVSEKKELYTYMSEVLPKKKWLFDLSANQRIKGTAVSDFFEQRPTFFDCVKDMDISRAYSLMQYFEGYYLIRESVKRGLNARKSTIQVAFVLPNDESKYYADLPNDIEKMLHLEFGEKLTDLAIKVTFVFFQYGESTMSRPYIDKRSKAPRVTPNEINAYFDYIG